MSKRVKSVGWWVSGLIAVAVLAVGAREAFASSSLMSCPNDGWNSMGYQPTWQACWNACAAVHSSLDGINWSPSSGCCRCLY